MIDEPTFRKAWTLLCERFNREPSTALMQAYYGTLSERMTTDEFRAAANQVFIAREFFPRPLDFLEAVRTDPRAEALDQWEQVQELMRGNIHQLTAEADRVVRILGGPSQLRNTQLEAVPFVRRDFLALYGDAVEISRREHPPTLQGGAEAKRIAGGVDLRRLK